MRKSFILLIVVALMMIGCSNKENTNSNSGQSNMASEEKLEEKEV